MWIVSCWDHCAHGACTFGWFGRVFILASFGLGIGADPLVVRKGFAATIAVYVEIATEYSAIECVLDLCQNHRPAGGIKMGVSSDIFFSFRLKASENKTAGGSAFEHYNRRFCVR